jgi:hypothetical protein
MFRHAGLPHFKWSNLLRVVVLKEPSGRSDLPSRHGENESDNVVAFAQEAMVVVASTIAGRPAGLDLFGLSVPGHVRPSGHTPPHPHGALNDRSTLARFISLLFAPWVASRRYPRAGA